MMWIIEVVLKCIHSMDSCIVYVNVLLLVITIRRQYYSLKISKFSSYHMNSMLLNDNCIYSVGIERRCLNFMVNSLIFFYSQPPVLRQLKMFLCVGMLPE